MPFTDRFIHGLKLEERQYDKWEGNGFGVRVSPGGRKSFQFMYRFDGTPQRLTFGAYPKLTLADARIKFGEARELLEKGINPSSLKAQEKKARQEAMTVKEVADWYLERWAKPEKRSWKEDERMLYKDLIPKLGDMKAMDVTPDHLYEIIERLETRGHVTAKRTFAVIRTMFRKAASGRRKIPSDPTAGVVPDWDKPVIRERVLKDDEIRKFWYGLDDCNLDDATVRALKLALVTGQRRGEVAAMSTDEIDFDEAIWVIPSSRTKNKREHIVPLTPAALELIQTGDSKFIFPKNGNPIRAQTLSRAMNRKLEKLGLENARPHDLRRTAATNLAKLGTSRIVLMKILNHSDKSVTAIYDQWEYMPEKRAALEKWATRLQDILGGDKTVVEFRHG